MFPLHFSFDIPCKDPTFYVHLTLLQSSLHPLHLAHPSLYFHSLAHDQLKINPDHMYVFDNSIKSSKFNEYVLSQNYPNF